MIIYIFDLYYPDILKYKYRKKNLNYIIEGGNNVNTIEF